MNKPPRRFFEFESFRVDATERQLWQNGKPVLLTPKVFDMLLILLENKGQTIEKDELIKKVWADTFVEEGSLNRNISTLRKALGDDSHEQRFIKTLPKRGYRFTAKVEEIVADEWPAPAKDVQSQLSTEKEASRLLKPSLAQTRTKIGIALLGILIFALVLTWAMNRPPYSKVSLTGLSENERQQLVKRGSSNLQAYEDYVNGRTLWHQRSAEGLHQSILLLERAVNADPNFALAQAALADAYAFDAERRKLAKAQAEKAIGLDPSLGQPYATIGFVEMFWEWKLTKARESFRKAIELSPENATAHQWYAINLAASGFGGAALSEMKRALELEPKSLAINADLCQIYYFLRKYDEALTQCQKTLELDPSFLNTHVYLYEIYTAKEMYDEAVAEFFKIEQLKSDYAIPFADQEKLRQAYASGGIRAFWQTLIGHLERNPYSNEIAKYYTRLTEKEKAVAWLKRSYETRDFGFVFVLVDPALQGLSKERELSEMVRKLIE